jgi:cell division protein FtsZ
VDTLIVIPNDRLLELTEKRMSLTESFRMADDVLRQGIQGITELITTPGLINLDFADVRTIMTEGGSALMAVGIGSGDERARIAAEQSISSRLLEVTIDGARGILFNITGGAGMTLYEVNQAAAIIREKAHPDANMIFGAVVDENMGDDLRITVIATGFDHNHTRRQLIPKYQHAEEGNGRSAERTNMKQAPVQDSVIVGLPESKPQRKQAEAADKKEEAKVESRFSPNNLEIPAFLRRR